MRQRDVVEDGLAAVVRQQAHGGLPVGRVRGTRVSVRTVSGCVRLRGQRGYVDEDRAPARIQRLAASCRSSPTAPSVLIAL